MVQTARESRSSCREHTAGTDLVLLSENSIRVSHPDGRREVAVREGRAVLAGLDSHGITTLTSGGISAHVVVQPSPYKDDVSIVEGQVRLSRPAVDRSAFLTSGLLLVGLIALMMGTARRPWLLTAVTVIFGGLLNWATIGGISAPLVTVVDVSGSMPVAETKEIVQSVEAKLGEAVSARVEGDDRVRRIVEPGEIVQVTGGQTRLSGVIDTAAELTGTRGVMVLISDGQTLDGAVATSIPVFTIPAASDKPDARILRGTAVALGERTFVRLELACDKRTQGTVRVGELTQDVRLEPGQTKQVNLVTRTPADLEFNAQLLVPDDRLSLNNQLPIPVVGQVRPRAVVWGTPGVKWAQPAGFDIQSIELDELMELGASLGTARGMVIADQAIDKMTPQVVARIERWVKAGGVLLLSGRKQAFGPGGWSGTRLEDISPLLAKPDEPKPPKTGVVVLIDRSGSISPEAGGLGLAEAGRLAGVVGDRLNAQDVLSVLAFGGEVKTLLPPTSVGELEQRRIPIPTIARGGTRLEPALKRAVDLLERVAVARKTIVMITDGQFADADGLDTLYAKLSSSGIRIFGLLVGDDTASEPMNTLCKKTSGRCRAISADRLKALADPILTLESSAFQSFGDRVLATEVWPQRVGGAAPHVTKRVRVKARKNARVLLRAGGDPLMAEWRLGFGRVIAVATDALKMSDEQWTALWSPALIGQPGMARFTVESDRLVVTTNPEAQPPVGLVEIRDREGRLTRLPWQPVGPGRSSVKLPSGPAEILTAETMTDYGVASTRFVRGHPQETLATKPNLERLRLQAELTGGDCLGLSVS